MLNGFPMSIIELRFKGNPCLLKPMKGAKRWAFHFWSLCGKGVCGNGLLCGDVHMQSLIRLTFLSENFRVCCCWCCIFFVAMALSVLSSTFSSAVPAASSSFFSGSQGDFQVNRGDARVTCRNTDIHPKFFNDAKVYCNGELVMTTGGTQGEYVVDVWSGNHPFYQGNKTALVLDADRVDKFKQRYAGLASLNTIPVLTKGEIVFEKKKKPVKGKGKK